MLKINSKNLPQDSSLPEDVSGNYDIENKSLVNVNKINDKEVNQLALTSYVDQQDSKQDIGIADKANKDEDLLLNGIKHMTGRLDMNAKKVINVADTTYEYGDAIDYRILRQKELAARLVINDLLPLAGTKSMTGDLDMNNNRIINIADGSNSGDAINYKQLVAGVVNLNNAVGSLNKEVLNKANKKRYNVVIWF